LAGVSFLYAKATDGLHSVDPQFAATAAACRDAGLAFGAYGVLEPDGCAEASTQAAHFVATAKDSGMTLPPWCDFELARGLTGLEALRSAAEWCDAVSQALGQAVLVYCGPSFIEGLERLARDGDIDVLDALGKRPLAVAHYTGHVSRRPTVPTPWLDWMFWQASGGRQVSPLNYAVLPGTNIDVDVDYFRGSMDELLATGH
jgi:lysozyme